MKIENIKVGEIVFGNNYAGKAKNLEGVVVSNSMQPPRSVKVKFKKLGYWLICPNELMPLDVNQKSTLTKEFIEDALKSTKIEIPRSKLIELLGQALNYITDDNLNNEINEVIANYHR